MKNKVLFFMTIVIMIIGLLFIGINRFIFSMPDWAVRITGIVMMIDLVVLVYSFVRNNHKNIV